jgi:hypothetical protein
MHTLMKCQLYHTINASNDYHRIIMAQPSYLLQHLQVMLKSSVTQVPAPAWYAVAQSICNVSLKHPMGVLAAASCTPLAHQKATRQTLQQPAAAAISSSSSSSSSSNVTQGGQDRTSEQQLCWQLKSQQSMAWRQCP